MPAERSGRAALRPTHVQCLLAKSELLSMVGRTDEAMSTAQIALVNATACGDRVLVADSACRVCDVLYNASRYQEMMETIKAIQPLCRELGYRSGIARCLNFTALDHDNEGRYREAIESYTRAAEVRAAIGDQYGLAISLQNAGFVYAEMGDYRRASDYFTQALQIAERENDFSAQATILSNIADCLESSGDLRQALEHLNRSQSFYQRIGSRSGQAYGLHSIGRTLHLLGDSDQGLRQLGQSVRMKMELNDQWALVCSLNMVARIHLEQDDPGRAAPALEQADLVAAQVGNKELFRRLAVTRGQLALAGGDTDQAVACKNKAVELAEELSARSGQTEALLLWAAIDEARGDHDAAIRRYDDVIVIYDGLGLVLERAKAQYYGGLSTAANGGTAGARSLLAAAAETFRRAGAATWLRRTEQALAALGNAT